MKGTRSIWPAGAGMVRHPPAHPPAFPLAGKRATPRSVERSGAFISPTAISRTRSKPWIITSMLERTTASPSRPNFFWYCL